MLTNRYERQVRLFGKEGQEKLSQVKVAIVGAGGLGSSLVEQLAYLGVRHFYLIDHDKLSVSNLNREIGAYPDDIDSRPLKVDILERLVLKIAPDTIVEKVPYSLVSTKGFGAVKRADFVFGCLDLEGVRLGCVDI